MRLSNVNQHVVLSSLFAILPLSISLFANILQPLWLDERASIYFASVFSYRELLYKFHADVHPGGYYILLKWLLGITTDFHWLRFFLGTIPFAISLLLLLKYPMKLLNRAVLLCLVGLNPLILYVSWQLRMYSLLVLVVVASFYFYFKYRNLKQSRHLLALILILFLGNMFHYTVFIFSSLFMGLLLNSGWATQKHKLMLILAALAIPFQFFVVSGYSGGSHFKNLAWVEGFSAATLARVVASMAGVGAYFHRQTEDVYFGFLTAGIIILLFKYKPYRYLRKEGLFLGVLPMVLVTGYSILANLNIRYMGSLLPQVSLLLPRALIPFYISLVVQFVDVANISYKKLGPLFLVLTVWFTVTVNTSFDPIVSEFEVSQHDVLRARALDYSDPIYLPSELVWDTISVLPNEKTRHVYTASLSIEDEFYESSSDIQVEKTTILDKEWPLAEKAQRMLMDKNGCKLTEEIDQRYQIFSCSKL